MTRLEKYAAYRKRTRELHSTILHTCVDREALMASARLLGVAQGTTIVFGSAGEECALLDFALHEYGPQHSNAVGIYHDITGWHDEVEREILDGLLVSYTSLCRVISISAGEQMLLLHDVLNSNDDVPLTDTGFSRTARPGILVFARFVPCQDFTMTSGLVFVFPGALESYLLKQYRRLAKTVASERDSARRQVAFFQLNRTDGLEVQYE